MKPDSIAVLPIVNATGDPNSEYLSEGITQDLVSTLSLLPNLKVVSLASAYRYKGKAIDPPTVARELGVHTILTGRMLQRGDNLSVSAEFVDAVHDRVMWSKQYQWKLADVPPVEGAPGRVGEDVADSGADQAVADFGVLGAARVFGLDRPAAFDFA